MLSSQTVGWLILAGALLAFGGGVAVRIFVGNNRDTRLGRVVRRFRESSVGGVLYGPVAADALDDDELDQTILMPTIVLGCAFLLTAIFLLGYGFVT